MFTRKSMPSAKMGQQKKNTARRWSLERFKVLNGLVDLGLRGLTRSELAIWLIVYRNTRPNGLARVSLSELAHRGGMSRRQATRALGALVDRGVVHVIRRGVIGKATVYSLYPPGFLAEICPQLGPWLRASPAARNVDTDVPNQGAPTTTIP